MTDTNPIAQEPKTALGASGVRRIFQVGVFLLLIAAAMFGGAGTMDWPEAWAYLALYLLAILLMGLWMLRANPELINERGRTGENVKPWDKKIGVFFLLFFLGMYVVAGIDEKLGLSAMLPWAKTAGLVGFVLSMLIVFSAFRANAYLSTMVRIQNERGHRVVDWGPYRIVRHPMYVGVLFQALATPLFLGSWWALIPGGLVIAVFIVRTALEDRMLQAELPGYREYTERTRYRLIPGLW